MSIIPVDIEGGLGSKIFSPHVCVLATCMSF